MCGQHQVWSLRIFVALSWTGTFISHSPQPRVLDTCPRPGTVLGSWAVSLWFYQKKHGPASTLYSYISKQVSPQNVLGTPLWSVGPSFPIRGSFVFQPFIPGSICLPAHSSDGEKVVIKAYVSDLFFCNLGKAADA